MYMRSYRILSQHSLGDKIVYLIDKNASIYIRIYIHKYEVKIYA